MGSAVAFTLRVTTRTLPGAPAWGTARQQNWKCACCAGKSESRRKKTETACPASQLRSLKAAGLSGGGGPPPARLVRDATGVSADMSVAGPRIRETDSPLLQRMSAAPAAAAARETAAATLARKWSPKPSVRATAPVVVRYHISRVRIFICGVSFVLA